MDSDDVHLPAHLSLALRHTALSPMSRGSGWTTTAYKLPDVDPENPWPWMKRVCVLRCQQVQARGKRLRVRASGSPEQSELRQRKRVKGRGDWLVYHPLLD